MSRRLLGKGRFTRAWADDRRPGMAMLETEDPAKEALALGWMPESPLLPRMKRTDLEGYDYETPLCRDLRAPCRELTAEDLATYRTLRKACQERRGILLLVADDLAGTPLGELLSGCYDALCNYATGSAPERDPRIEISPRNVGIGPDGRMVLRDVFFLASRLADRLCR